jgi:hypothetical protein
MADPFCCEATDSIPKGSIDRGYRVNPEDYVGATSAAFQRLAILAMVVRLQPVTS